MPSSISVTSAAIGDRSDRVSVTCAKSGWPLRVSITAAHLPTDVVLLAGLHRVRQVEHLARAEIHDHALLRVSHATRRLPRCAGPNPPYARGGRVIASTSRAASRSVSLISPRSTNPRSSTAWRTVT